MLWDSILLHPPPILKLLLRIWNTGSCKNRFKRPNIHHSPFLLLWRFIDRSKSRNRSRNSSWCTPLNQRPPLVLYRKTTPCQSNIPNAITTPIPTRTCRSGISTKCFRTKPKQERFRAGYVSIQCFSIRSQKRASKSRSASNDSK